MKQLNVEKEKFDQICDEWLSYKKLRIKESTYSNYSFKINRYIKKILEEKDYKI